MEMPAEAIKKKLPSNRKRLLSNRKRLPEQSKKGTEQSEKVKSKQKRLSKQSEKGTEQSENGTEQSKTIVDAVGYNWSRNVDGCRVVSVYAGSRLHVTTTGHTGREF